MIEKHLAQAERHVAQGERHMEQQRALAEKMEHDGHDTQEAYKLLAQFEGLQDLHVADGDRLRRELAECE